MNKWKKGMLGLTIAGTVLGTGAVAAAAADTTGTAPAIYIDGKRDNQVMVYKSRAYLRLIDYSDTYYTSYKYDEKTGMTVVVRTLSGTKIQLKPGSSKAFVDGKAVTLPYPILAANGRTYVPIDFLTDYLGAVRDGGADYEVILRTTSGQYAYDLYRTGGLGNARSVAVHLPLVFEDGMLAPTGEGKQVTYTFPEGEAHRFLVESDGMKRYVEVDENGIARVKWQKDSLSTNEMGAKPDDFGLSYWFRFNEDMPDTFTYGSTTSSMSGGGSVIGTYTVGKYDMIRNNTIMKLGDEKRTDGVDGY